MRSRDTPPAWLVVEGLWLEWTRYFIMTGDSSRTILPLLSVGTRKSQTPSNKLAKVLRCLLFFSVNSCEDGAANAQMFTTNVQVDHATVQDPWHGDPDEGHKLLKLLLLQVQRIPRIIHHLCSPIA